MSFCSLASRTLAIFLFLSSPTKFFARKLLLVKKYRAPEDEDKQYSKLQEVGDPCVSVCVWVEGVWVSDPKKTTST